MPEFVLVDVELGGEDGFELARSLLEQDPALRIVMTSAYEFDDLAELAAGCGAAGFIPKSALSAARSGSCWSANWLRGR